MLRHLTLAVLAAASLAFAEAEPTPPAGTDASSGFQLSSPDIAAGASMNLVQVYDRFGCHGQNISPALSWRGAPAHTQSFALLLHDPDAPMPGGFWHWLVYDIPAGVSSLPADAGNLSKHLMPAAAVQARTGFGVGGYGGPCPPPGAPHHYFFSLYALKVAHLGVAQQATPEQVRTQVEANALGKAELVALYGR
jgi:Raf kinase inhibitor-like YbhB/YbcL family protein